MQCHRLFLSRYSTLYNEVKAGKKNHSLLHTKANKFSRNALIDLKLPGVTAHNTAFKSPFTIMSKFYHSGHRIAFFQPSLLSWNPRYSSLIHRFENSLLSDRDCLSKTTLARVRVALLLNANCYLVKSGQIKRTKCMWPLFVGFAIYQDKLQWFPGKFYEPDLHLMALRMSESLGAKRELILQKLTKLDTIEASVKNMDYKS